MRLGRPTRDETFMEMAIVAARRSTCLRRAVGCVLVDSRGRILSVGYNGVAAGQPHCNEVKFLHDGESDSWPSYPNACQGAFDKGGALALCGAVHAEQNALLQCRDPDVVHTAYVTLSPCDSCLKLFLNTGCKRLVIGEWWRDSEELIRKRWLPREVDTLYMERMANLRGV